RTRPTDMATPAGATDAAATRGAHAINLTLATAEMHHRERLAAAVANARAHGAVVVAAREDDGVRWLPGCLAGVVGVQADARLDRHIYEIRRTDRSAILLTAPFPRDIPGVPRERNVNGVSFAV